MERWIEQEFEQVFENIKGILKVTYKEKRDECKKLFNFLGHLFVLTDIGEDIYRVEGDGIPFYISALTVRTYLEFLANLLQGAYHSAGRSLRWLYEANLAGATACIDPSLLDDQFKGKKSITLDEFEKWLALYDKRERKLKRSNIFKALKLPKDELQNLYSDLCKYSHISKTSFDKKLIWPKLQYIPEKFDEILGLTWKTLDLVLWLECNVLLRYEGTERAFRDFLKYLGALTSYIPMTAELLFNLINRS